MCSAVASRELRTHIASRVASCFGCAQREPLCATARRARIVLLAGHLELMFFSQAATCRGLDAPASDDHTIAGRLNAIPAKNVNLWWRCLFAESLLVQGLGPPRLKRAKRMRKCAKNGISLESLLDSAAHFGSLASKKRHSLKSSWFFARRTRLPRRALASVAAFLRARVFLSFLLFIQLHSASASLFLHAAANKAIYKSRPTASRVIYSLAFCPSSSRTRHFSRSDLRAPVATYRIPMQIVCRSIISYWICASLVRRRPDADRRHSGSGKSCRGPAEGHRVAPNGIAWRRKIAASIFISRSTEQRLPNCKFNSVIIIIIFARTAAQIIYHKTCAAC